MNAAGRVRNRPGLAQSVAEVERLLTNGEQAPAQGP